ncbi:acetyltransferase-like isoleucine patch superfamily enzyme [Pedobacter sp. AK017]|uniref:acyltransferase n=1 Tax=Pedobacter sp. AK017 TaxID=2723073 RepID=UPI0016198216|nr:acyltransferase [Pedobacter sp. AK017]MBB5436381.1 acetyltransferase-like isoleucine patch superfamily enzyme [Pedobacter sp. AK017]
MPSFISTIKSNPRLKKIALLFLIPANDHKPRLWVRWFLNPFRHTRGKQTIIRRKTRMDVFPFNEFNLGSRSIIEDFATINNGVGDVNIGEHTIIGLGNVIIGPITIGNNVMFAQNIVASGLNHGFEDADVSPSQQKVNCKLITIADDVWIGANSVITAGVTIGRHSVIGAGSIVTKDIPEFCVAVGNPARIIKKYNPVTKNWDKLT